MTMNNRNDFSNLQLSDKLTDNIKLLEQIFPLDKCFDLITRELYLRDTKAYWIGINGFCTNDILQEIISDLQNPQFTEDAEIKDLKKFVASKIGYVQAEITTDWNSIVKQVLSGASVLFVDGFASAVILDTRHYPARSVDEPDNEKVTRGSKDGFVETIVFNTALIRRHIRNPNLCFEINTVGSETKTDVSIAYIDGIVDEDILKKVRTKIKEVDVPALTMGSKTLEELIIKKRWWNPLPQIRYTERPDVACSYLLEGYVLVIVDNSPTVMVFPCTLFQFTQNPEDYYQSPAIGNYLRIVRFACILLSLYLMPVFFLLGVYQDELPSWLQVITTERVTPVALFVYVMIIEIALDVFKYSSSLAASGLSGSIGLIGGLIIGDVAIELNFATKEVIFYGAATMLVTLSISSQEFGGALRLYRLFIIITTGIASFFGLGIWGFVIGFVLTFLSTITTPSLSGKNYLWPLYPFNWKALRTLLFRYPTAKYETEKHTEIQK